VNLSIEIRGLDKIVAKFGKGADPIIKALTRGIAEDIRARMAKYPGPVKYPIKWASPAQRRAYFAKRRAPRFESEADYGDAEKAKGLPLKYTRQSDDWSERLGPSWATENRGLDAVVGTRVSYAPWVQSKERQQPMHAATGWITDEDAVQAAIDENVPEKTLEEILREW
jgi:hypothetical protein